jgi:hypothetical protein
MVDWPDKRTLEKIELRTVWISPETEPRNKGSVNLLFLAGVQPASMLV